MSSNNYDNRNKSVVDSIIDTKDQLAAKFNKNKEAAKEEYHHDASKNSNNLVDQVIHKKDELVSNLNKNSEAAKDNYYANK